MSDTPLSDLLFEHENIYRELRPSIAKYSELAGRVVALQQEIFSRRLRDTYPDMAYDVVPKVATVAATDNMPSLNAALDALREAGITPTHTLFDPVRNEFHIFSSAAPAE